VSITVILFVSLIIGILAFIYQISDIASDFADIRKNVTLFITDIQRYIRTNFHVSLWEQRKYLEDVNSVKRKETIGTTNVCYGHPFRYYLNSYLYFLDSFIQNPFHLILTKLFRKEHHSKLQEILSQIKGSVQSYISGLIIEMILFLF
jgi:predicted PurR-regulated permease PerM